MADERACDSVFGKEGTLEEQQRHDVIEVLRKLLRAAGTPTPLLRYHVMAHGSSRGVQAMRDAQARARGMDGDDCVRLEAARSIGGLVEQTDQARQMRQHLGQPHERELSHGKKTLESFACAL